MQTTRLTLLRSAGAGGREAWVELDRFYRPFIHSWFCGRKVSPEDVDDLTQEVLATLFRELPDFEHSGRTGAFRCWLRSTCLNRLLDHRRKLATRDCLSTNELNFETELASVDDPNVIAWDREHDQAMLRYLFSLIAKSFESETIAVFRRLVLDDCPAAEVAVEFGMSVGAVYVARSRVLRRLREEGERLGDDEFGKCLEIP